MQNNIQPRKKLKNVTPKKKIVFNSYICYKLKSRTWKVAPNCALKHRRKLNAELGKLHRIEF